MDSVWFQLSFSVHTPKSIPTCSNGHHYYWGKLWASFRVVHRLPCVCPSDWLSVWPATPHSKYASTNISSPKSLCCQRGQNSRMIIDATKEPDRPVCRVSEARGCICMSSDGNLTCTHVLCLTPRLPFRRPQKGAWGQGYQLLCS